MQTTRLSIDLNYSRTMLSRADSSQPAIHGLAMLQAASLVLAKQSPPVDQLPAAGTACAVAQRPSLNILLNPAPSDIGDTLPQGFVLGKDGKIKKKRGRKPTPGLTDEGRRQARLLKNRRTAEVSRRRKLALLHQLTSERDEARNALQAQLTANGYLTRRLADALGMSVDSLCRADPLVGLPQCEVTAATLSGLPSDVTRPPSVADSDDEVLFPSLTVKS